MKLFRHPPLMGWTVICLAMVGVLLLALVVGGDAEVRPDGVADRRQAVEDVMELRYRLADLTRVATPPATGLPEWSRETSRLANEAAQRRVNEGAPLQDALVQTFQTLSKDAANLAEVDPSDTSAVRAGVALVRADGDALTAVLGGAEADAVKPMPGEDTPIVVPREDGADAPLPGADPELPAIAPGAVPAVPAVPVTPRQGGTPDTPVIPADPATHTTGGSS